jgi:Family of unknown function (DUF6513)
MVREKRLDRTPLFLTWKLAEKQVKNVLENMEPDFKYTV